MEIRLRPWSIEDLDSLVSLANDPEVARWLTDGFPHPYTPAAGQAFLEKVTAKDPVHVFCIEVNGQVAGGCGIYPLADIFRMNAELGYWLGAPFRQRGIMKKVLPLVVQKAFEIYDISRVFARPFGDNLPSQKVLEATGFTLEARLEGTLIKHGQLKDELIYAVRRDTWVARQRS